MTPEDAREFTEAHKQVGTGWWREIAWAQRQGIPEALGMTFPAWVNELGTQFRLDIAERREAVAELTKEGMKQREIASVLGVDQKTVSNDLREENSSKTVPPDASDLPDSGSREENSSHSAAPATLPDPKIKRRSKEKTPFERAMIHLNDLHRASRLIVDECAEGLDHHQTAEIMLNIENIREQLQFALITLGERVDG